MVFVFARRRGDAGLAVCAAELWAGFRSITGLQPTVGPGGRRPGRRARFLLIRLEASAQAQVGSLVSLHICVGSPIDDRQK